MRKDPGLPGAHIPEWTGEDLSRARPALGVRPTGVVDALGRGRGQRGPQEAPTRELISLRVD